VPIGKEGNQEHLDCIALANHNAGDIALDGLCELGKGRRGI
jgi:hypothetical protein